MIPLFTCKSCGFLSTFAGAYTRRSGVRFCNSCAEGYDEDIPPTNVWCREAIDAAHRLGAHAMSVYDEERGRERARFHPIHYLRVASHFWPWERAFWLALFHDSVEDGWTTTARLHRWFGPDFADDIMVLTRPKIGTYADYIEAVRRWYGSHSFDAVRVKRADLAENYARAPSSLRKRYAKAMDVLA